MKNYELTVLIHPDLESDIEAPLSKVRALIEKNGGKVIAEDNWGKKKLAYTIKKEAFAVYVHMEVSLPSEAPLKISNTLNITDEVLRYLLVTVDEKLKQAIEAAAQKAYATSDEE